jgi:hypothetical protein
VVWEAEANDEKLKWWRRLLPLYTFWRVENFSQLILSKWGSFTSDIPDSCQLRLTLNRTRAKSESRLSKFQASPISMKARTPIPTTKFLLTKFKISSLTQNLSFNFFHKLSDPVSATLIVHLKCQLTGLSWDWIANFISFCLKRFQNFLLSAWQVTPIAT